MTKPLHTAGKMTEGSVLRHMLMFSLPLLLGNALQQFYNMADSVVVGRALGKTALAGVGASGPVVFMIISLFMGVGTGATILISQCHGAGDIVRLRRAVNTIYTALLFVAIPLSLLGFFSSDIFLRVLHVPQDAYAQADIYLKILMSGLIGALGYNLNSGILQGMGDSKTPLFLLAISSAINIGLDLLFVFVFGFGVAGVAIATVVAQCFSWLCGIFIIKKKYEHLQLKPLSFQCDKELLAQVLRLGLPSGFHHALFGMSTLFMARLVNSYGSAFAAGFNGASRIDTFVLLPVQSIAIAATTFTGQNIGAKKLDRVKEGTKTAMFLGLILAAAGCLLLPFASTLMQLFSSDKEVIAAGVGLMQRILPFYWLMNISLVFNSVMRGAGDAILPMVSGVISLWLARIPSAYLFAHYFGPNNMHYCYLAGWILGLCITVPYYFSGKWKIKALA